MTIRESSVKLCSEHGDEEAICIYDNWEGCPWCKSNMMAEEIILSAERMILKYQETPVDGEVDLCHELGDLREKIKTFQERNK
jgi:hypothetical protein